MERLTEQLLEALAWPDAPPAFLDNVRRTVRFHRLNTGEALFGGDACGYMPVVLSGRLRVFRTAENGREITLYRVGAGESCVLSIQCVLDRSPVPVRIVAEGATDVALLPADQIEQWIHEYEVFRRYVHETTTERLLTTITTLSEVAFARIDTRLIELILRRTADGPAEFAATHQDLAGDLGTAREVVSRILKDLERDGLLALQRGVISVVDRAALSRRLDTVAV